ncbi:unnamed protein product [Bursaphelenchus okinawaensis]|uniref:Uncharacterized protein n=1 Tax=Bursaphelenchus okinawaensis TaxID=465554 RepID=A0A811L7K2_9BILA|nr:unnamed protein product [Bursaphelenchus okinawaensis]CAG9118097.1 unnamed protein product [Bursaphelenchus okinawaensis]
MSIVCVPHNYAVIRLEEGSEVKIVKKRQLRMNAFANGATCKLIVHDGCPRNAKIVRTFTTSSDAKTYLNNINTAKQSWGFTTTTRVVEKPPTISSEASTSAPNRTNICQSKGLSESIICTNMDNLVKVVHNRQVPVLIKERKRSNTKMTQDFSENLQKLLGRDTKEDEKEVKVRRKSNPPKKKVVKAKTPEKVVQPRREMTYDLSGLTELDSGLSEASNPSNSSPDWVSDNSNDETPNYERKEHPSFSSSDICSMSMALLPKILSTIEKQGRIVEDLRSEHDGLQKSVADVVDLFGELEQSGLINKKNTDRLDYSAVDLGITKHKLDSLYMNASHNPLGFFQLVCRYVFEEEKDVDWSDRSEERKSAVESILNHYFPSTAPSERFERFVKKLFRRTVTI